MARISLGVCLMLLVASSAVYEVQGTFLLRHYLRKFPRKSYAFQPFACKGMLKFVNVLELKCPLKPEYKNFFGKLRTYMSFISSASGSSNYDGELKRQAEGLHNAMSAMGGKSGSVDSSKVLDVLLSMGKTLGETRRSGATTMTFEQRKELIMSMAKWARTISQFVASTASTSGASIDISSLGIDDIDVSADAGGSPTNGGTSNTGTGSSTQTSSATQTTTGGGSTCATSACSTGSGSNSFKGSLNYQQQSGMGSSQQTSTTTSN